MVKTGLTAGTEFWDAEHTLNELTAKGYFKRPSKNAKEMEDDSADGSFPPALVTLQETGQTFALSALGGCISYLRRLILDEELIPMRRFALYDPSEATNAQYLVLDGQVRWRAVGC